MTERNADDAAGRADGARRPASSAVLGRELPADADATLLQLRPRDVAVALLTYNNADTVRGVLDSVTRGLERALPGASAVVLNADAGSSDGTSALFDPVPLPVVHFTVDAPAADRLTVPFHGVPGRGMALHAVLTAAHRVGAHALVLLEADLASPSPDWAARLAGPVLENKADFVAPVYERHRYEGTITNLLLAPLIRALYGRRIHQPLGGQQSLSARLVEHLLIHPHWDWRVANVSDVWVLGTAIADGFSVWETSLGRRTIRSRLRTTDLPAMVAQTVGGVFDVMHRHEDLWLAVQGSEPVPQHGERAVPSVGRIDVDVRRMVEGFRLGLRDLVPIWEHILAPDTLGDVLSLGVSDAGLFPFPDDLWARIVYDFALGYHYDVIYREHLLRSLVPLYLGRTAAFVLATQASGADTTEAAVEGTGVAFERQKPYLVERWR